MDVLKQKRFETLWISEQRLQERLRVRLGGSARDKSFRDEIAEVLKDIPEPKQAI
jgi:hypothetical protein